MDLLRELWPPKAGESCRDRKVTRLDLEREFLLVRRRHGPAVQLIFRQRLGFIPRQNWGPFPAKGWGERGLEENRGDLGSAGDHMRHGFAAVMQILW